MKPYLIKNQEFISYFNKLSPKRKRKLIPILNKDQINTISEICKNFLKRNLTQDRAIVNKLKSARGDINAVSLKSCPLYKKKKILQSRKGGAILSVLLPLAASVITSLLSSRK